MRSLIAGKSRLILTIVFLVPLIIEMFLRLFAPPAFEYYRNLKELHIYHPEYLVGLAPGVDINLKDNKGLWEGRFQTNSLGMRGSRELQKDQPKLACVGDSMVMGFGVSDQEAFCTKLDNAQFGTKKYQSLNLSVDAFGSRGYAKRIEEVTKMTRLDVVLLFVSPNDFTMPEELRARGILSDDETDTIRFNDQRYLQIFKYRFILTRYSYLAHAILVATQQLMIRTQLLLKSIPNYFIQIGLFENNKVAPIALKHEPNMLAYLKYAFYREPVSVMCDQSKANLKTHETPIRESGLCNEVVPEFVQCVDHESADLAELMPITRQYYKEIIELSKKYDFKLVPVFLPIQDQALYCAQSGKHAKIYNYALQANRFFQSQGVTSLDLSKHVKKMCIETNDNGEALQIRDMYIHGDGHYTAAGNSWVSKYLKIELGRLLYVL